MLLQHTLTLDICIARLLGIFELLRLSSNDSDLTESVIHLLVHSSESMYYIDMLELLIYVHEDCVVYL